MKKEDLQKMWFEERIAEALQIGLQEVRKMIPDYNPAGPHLVATARGDASTFNPEFSGIELIIELARNCSCSVESSDTAIILEIRVTDSEGNWVDIGTERYSAPEGEGPWTVVETDHGLMVEGPCIITEKPTHEISAIFTKEGDDYYVLASLHPGKAQKPGNYTNLKPGDQLTRNQLAAREIERVKPIE